MTPRPSPTRRVIGLVLLIATSLLALVAVGEIVSAMLADELYHPSRELLVALTIVVAIAVGFPPPWIKRSGGDGDRDDEPREGGA